jgi:hypothetical protein
VSSSCGELTRKASWQMAGKIKVIVIISGFTNSQKFSWMNRLLVAGESEFDPAAQQFRVTANDWI